MEDADEAVGELVGGLRLVEERVDVVVLHEVAGAGADDVERAGDDGVGLPGAGHRRQLRLVLLEVLQLLGQRDRVLRTCLSKTPSRYRSCTPTFMQDQLS